MSHPIAKVTKPETENDLRPISLTPFFSKVAASFVVDWILKYTSEKIDSRQYGGLKGNSTTHYIIEFLNFILMSQDTPGQTAVVEFYVDFQKAFNRQDHNLLIKKLSEMDVPGWLLSIVIAFLSNRRMLVRYNGCESSIKTLPGGGPQGTLLALLLFLILINDIGCQDCDSTNCLREIHLKFVDDLTVAEAVNLQKDVIPVPFEKRQLPDNYHQRTGHHLPNENSKVFKQLCDIEKYAIENHMKINFSKTQLMVFNPCHSIDFYPEMSMEGKAVEVVKEKKLLGLTIRSDLKWSTNTSNMTAKAFKRLWILRRLKILGADRKFLLEVYIKQVRSTLELSVPAWQGSLTIIEKTEIERVQKCAAHIVLGTQYTSYLGALQELGLETLEQRRIKLCLKFALKAERNPKYSSWFIPYKKNRDTRSVPPKYCKVKASHWRSEKGPIGFLTDLLNQHYNK